MISFCVWPDFERVIGHHIQHENYRGALEVLTKQTDVELYYRFSPLLMQYVPKETVEAWVKQGRHLEPKKLIPALVQYDHMRNREQVLKHSSCFVKGLHSFSSGSHQHLPPSLPPHTSLLLSLLLQFFLATILPSRAISAHLKWGEN